MFSVQKYSGNRRQNYELVINQLKALVQDEKNAIANMANASALLHQFLEHINWVGFYIKEEQELVLGPFQGLPACIRIPLGRGVCGTAAKTKKTVVVSDVHQFPGHIACDSASNSEIVVPMIKAGEVIGVLDIDSPNLNRFNEVDRHYLELFVEALVTTM
ncbi:GAF domain-containing protein [Ectobacillus polymachus]|uniref:GAF domain-containing protein n=1 Tax=Ectobacillus polymachus TaxID=1508806 RepID=UPI003A86FB30